MMYDNVYSLDMDKFVLNLLPIRLRNYRLYNWLVSLVHPLKTLHGFFTTYRLNTNYKIEHTAQVFSMEEVLNDAFDSIQKRIYIEDGIYRFPVWFYDRADDKPVRFYDRADDQPVRFYDRATLQQLDVDFIVVLPNGLNLSDPEMIRLRALVDYYRLPDKTYEVTYG